MSSEAISLPQPRVYTPDKMITLVVGPDEQRMYVHEDFLSQDSQFFRAAMKQEWRPNRKIKLPDESPIHMGYYIGHMYGDAPPTSVLKTEAQCDPGLFPCFDLLAELYVLGERRLDAKYQNAIIREMFRLVILSHQSPGIECVRIIYGGTTKLSPARRIVVDFAAVCCCDYWLKVAHEDSEREFWHDLSAVLIRSVQSLGLKCVGSLPVDAYLVDEDA
jgi:hypothetical protein